MCSQNKIPVTEFEQTHPFLLHAKLGAYVAKAKYGVTDQEILSSITWHTTGKPDMTLLEKIVYIADYIEPKRDKAPNLVHSCTTWIWISPISHRVISLLWLIPQDKR